MSRITKYKRSIRYQKKYKKYIVGCTSILIFLLIGGLVASLKVKSDNEIISANVGMAHKVKQADNSEIGENTPTDSQSNDSQSTDEDSKDKQSTNDDSKDKQSTSDDSKDAQSTDDQSTDNQSTDNQSTTKENDSEVQKDTQDKSKYNSLQLNKDPNADDVIELFNTTEKLIKGEIKYPVRKDGKKIVYLTFDDGPSTTNTPKILDTLKANNIKATFFIMGKQIKTSKESTEILKRTVKEGHAIGNHTYGHDYKYLYPNNTINVDNFMNDVDKCDKELKSVLGNDFSTRAVRFPGGYWSWKGRENIKPVILGKGYGIIDWNTLSEDAQGKPNKTAEELTETTRHNLDALGPNADSVVLLMHDTYGKEETAKSLQPIINIFKEKGFEFRTMK